MDKIRASERYKNKRAELTVDSNIQEVDKNNFVKRMAWMLTKSCLSTDDGLVIIPKITMTPEQYKTL